MGASIPVSTLFNVQPGVIGPGGQAIGMNGLILDGASNRVPNGTVYSFASYTAVGAFFGAGSTEATLASAYFGAYVGASQVPAKLYFVQDPYGAPSSAWLWGGAVTLAGVQTISSGGFSILIDGISRSVSGLNLSSASSLSNAAASIQTALNTGLPTATGSQSYIATVGGVPTLTVGGTVAGTWAPGMAVTGSTTAANTIILAQLSGTAGGAGTYQVSIAQTVGSSGSPVALTGTAVAAAVAYDSVTGALTITSGISTAAAIAASSVGFITAATGGTGALMLQQAFGAYISPSSPQMSPSQMMSSVVSITTNFVSFMTTYLPGQLTNFSSWLATQKQQFAWVAWDTDPNASVQGNTTCFGYQMQQAPVSGVIPIGGDPAWASAQSTTLAAILPPIAAAIMGTIAAINFGQKNGRLNFAFRQFNGLLTSVGALTTSQNLQANGYNFYGAYANNSQNFQWFQPGSIVGPFLSITRFVNQIWLNTSLQSANANFLSSVNSVPYNTDGYNAVAGALQSTIKAAKKFGAIRAGVELSSSQQQTLIGASNVGAAILPALFANGWYLQVTDPGGVVRAAGGSPNATFWYTDGGDVGQINLGSYDVI
jgi:hypothetical protein